MLTWTDIGRCCWWCTDVDDDDDDDDWLALILSSFTTHNRPTWVYVSSRTI